MFSNVTQFKPYGDDDYETFKNIFNRHFLYGDFFNRQCATRIGNIGY